MGEVLGFASKNLLAMGLIGAVAQVYLHHLDK